MGRGHGRTMKKASEPEPLDEPGHRTKGWVRVLHWAAVLGVWTVIVLAAGAAYIAWDLPNIDEAIAATRSPTVRVISQDGVELARRGDRYGPAVRLDDLPPALSQAVLATEDRRFYDHWGVDPIGIARAMWVNLRAGRIRQGGSTLTQQAAKNLFLSSRRTLKRKLQEVVLALWLEARFTKDQILTIYLNRVYFGLGVYGVEAAARYYFAVSARDLTVYQSALLAGMLKGPNKFNPKTNPERARQRTLVVLDNMVAAGYLNQADRATIRAPEKWWRYGEVRRQPTARYYVDWVLDQVGAYVTLDRDVTVTVSLNARIQQGAENLVQKLMKKGGAAARRGVSQVALVALAPDGAVVAMVGGANYAKSQFNRAVQARRQPGSAFKPVVFLAGFEAGLSPGSVVRDEPLTIENWSPRNFKNQYLGDITLAEAMFRSINTVAVKVSERAGRGRVRDMARKLGITAPLTDAPSLALGVGEVSLLEMTAAYAPFATGGIGVWAYGIVRIDDMSGQPLYVRSGGGPGRVISATYARAMNAMLLEVVSNPKGTGKGSRIQRPSAGKTGTSQGYRDAWFIGYTADLIAGVWMGNDNAEPMKGVTGGSFPARLWRDFATMALRDIPPGDLPGSDLGDVAGEQPAGQSKKSDKSPIKGFFEGLFNGLFGD